MRPPRIRHGPAVLMFFFFFFCFCNFHHYELAVVNFYVNLYLHVYATFYANFDVHIEPKYQWRLGG